MSVLQLVSDRELRHTLGKRGKSRVMEFDISTSVSNLEKAYQECLRTI
jgi:hypothetical protein